MTTPHDPRSGPQALPCLLSDICNETPGLRPKIGRAILVLELMVEEAARVAGLERLGFLTLTFRDHVTDKREAQRRFHSLRTGVLLERYAGGLVVWERQRSQRLHAHLLVILSADIRTGVDFDAIADRDYRSAPPALREEWAFWRKTAPRYGFGRTELLPIKSEVGAIASYVGKYLQKDLGIPEDKGSNRYAAFGCLKGIANQRHQPVHSSRWRQAVGEFVQDMARHHGVPPTWHGMELALGKNWMFQWRDVLCARTARLWAAQRVHTP